MSERINSNNLDKVVQENKNIASEIYELRGKIFNHYNPLRINSPSVLCFKILEKYNLIMIPRENVHWSGAIYVRDGKKIPVINTSLPRVNQYFAAWHEIYHILFDEISFDYEINVDNYMEERKAEYFASIMLIGDVNSYYNSLDDDVFEDRIFRCMAMFQAPYKAILISLYEEACMNNNEPLKSDIKKHFEISNIDVSERFDQLGLDKTLVLPSDVINTEKLFSAIKTSIAEQPDVSFHKDNLTFLEKTIEQIKKVNKENFNVDSKKI